MTIHRIVVGMLRGLLSVGLFALGSWPGLAHAAAGAIWVSGAEIQDYRYEAGTQVHAGFSTTTKHTGNAAFALHSGGTSGVGYVETPVFGSPVTNGTVYASAWVYIPSNACPGGCNGAIMMAASVAALKFNSSTSGVTLFRGLTQIGSAYTITTNAWHLFELKISIDADSTADDVIEARIDGAVRGSQTTSSVDTGSAAVNFLRFLSPNLSTMIGGDVFVDDIIVTSDEYVGLDGHVIMRTADGTGYYGAGSSTVAFSGCTSYQSCWSQVPPDDLTTGTNANDGTGSFAKFLATIGDFSAGTDAMTSADTLFGCRGTWSIAKGPNGQNRNWEMLRRIDLTGSPGTETNMPGSGGLDLTTTFSRYDDLECTLPNCGPWGACTCPPCTSGVDSVQLGGVRDNATQAKLMKIGGVYASCAYRRNTPVYVKTLSGTLDVGYASASHDQAAAESLSRAVLLSHCVGTTQQTCDLCASATGQALSVTPSTNGGVPTCLVSTATGDFTGSITYTGSVSSVDALTVSLPQKIGIYVGNSPPTPPCPTCSGASLGDTGTCQGGPNNGQFCVVDGTYGTLGNTSASCLPSTASLITTMFPALSATSTGPHSLAATFPCGSYMCPCPHQAAPDQCLGETCASDEMCETTSSILCFPDPIVRDGSTSPLTVAGVGCIPATLSGAVNSSVGLPGPIAVSLDLQVSTTP